MNHKVLILALLAESHISFHTFPEKGVISFDFFTCGKVNPSIALDIVKKEFAHKRIVKKVLNYFKYVQRISSYTIILI